ncbi:AAA family ATPase [Bacteroides sp.]
MVLNSFSIQKLFGVYSYEFTLQELQNLFIITGPNGYGKTTILNIINSLYTRDLFYFYQLDFEKIEIGLNNNQLLRIVCDKIEEPDEQDNGDRKVTLEKQIDFLWFRNKKMISCLSLNKRMLRKAARNIGYYKGYHADFHDLMSDDFYAFMKENGRMYDLLSKEQGQEQFLMLLNSIPSMFIKAQRLFVSNGDANNKSSSSIDMVVEHLRNRMREDYFKYLQMSQQKDSRFIDILLTSDVIYDENEYNKKIERLKPKIEELRSFGLINMAKIRPFESKNAKVLSAYIDELYDKIDVYAKTLEKLRLFSSLLKKKEFAHKTITFSPDFGLRIKTATDEFLDVNKLSSGEQNEIIMLYNFIFEVPDKAILLIDEPEISLHVAWQQEFVNDIEEISRLKDFQIIIATHSPQVIGGRWNECFDLYTENIDK